MELVPVLLIVVALLSLFSAIFVLIGSERSRKVLAVFYALLCLTYAGWTAFLLRDNESLQFWLSVAVFVMLVISIIYSIIMIKVSGHTRPRVGWRIILIATLILAIVAAVIVFVLPIFNIYFTWVGAFVLSPLFLLYYYCSIRFRTFLISNKALKLWSYVSLAAVCITIYMVLFYIISKFLFKIETTAEVISLNLVMVIIVIMIFPIWYEINSEIKSLLATKDVNLTYVIKKLNSFATQNIKYEKMALFLADHLHFRYIGLVVNGKIYGTRPLKISAETLAELTMLDVSEKSLWQEPRGHIKQWLEGEDIVAVAELRDAKGRPFGQMLVGKPYGKITFEKRDLGEIETIVNLVASIVDSKERLKS